jgi:hypothetical protein
MSGIKFKNCLFDACKISIEMFRMPTDGRKWKAAAGNRKTLMIQLAGYANADGTSIRPSTITLAEQTGFSRRKVCYLLDDLKMLGLCERVGRYGQKGPAIRRLMVPESARFNSQSATFIPESAKYDSESAGLDPESATATAHNLPYRPANEPAIQPATPSEAVGRMVDSFGQRRNMLPQGLRSGLNPRRVLPDLARLIETQGADMVCQAWDVFLDQRGFEGMRAPCLTFFLREFEADWKTAAIEATLAAARRIDSAAIIAATLEHDRKQIALEEQRTEQERLAEAELARQASLSPFDEFGRPRTQQAAGENVN